MRQSYLVFIFIFSTFFLQNIFSQNFTRANDWRKYRKEVVVSFGASGFLGDLGGLNKIGTDYSPVDIEFSLTRPAASLGYRYKISKNFNVLGSFNYLLVKGDDKLTSETFRNNRNLNFKSNIFELSVRAEFSAFWSKVGHRYGIKKTLVRRHKTHSNEFIFFVGIGGFYFNPKGMNPNTGQYEQLYYLHTEGEGLPNGPPQYKRVSISIPMGIQWRVAFRKIWSFGVEYNFRKTFTDYIDDVHGTYYDKAALEQAYGSKAVLMGDPSLGNVPGQTYLGDGTPQQRGDKQNDSYMSLQVTVGRFFVPKRKKTKLRSKF